MDDMVMTPTPTMTVTAGQAIAWLGFASLYLIILAVVVGVAILASWKIFTKAGQAGWKSLIPIYNTFVLLQIVGRPGWWLLLFLIPGVNFIISLIVSIDLGKSFNKSAGFSVVMLWFLSLIGYCVLAFSEDAYVGPGGVAVATPNPSAGNPAPEVPPAPTEAPAVEAKDDQAPKS